MAQHRTIFDLQTQGLFVTQESIGWTVSALAQMKCFYIHTYQMPYKPVWKDETDLKVHPGVILGAKLPRIRKKISSLARSKILVCPWLRLKFDDRNSEPNDGSMATILTI
jgi:hypothetical protein